MNGTVIISDVNMAYSEHARRYLAECGRAKQVPVNMNNYEQMFR